jgi:hypothetical protein
MKEVTVTARDGKQSPMDSVYIRGSMIRCAFVVVALSCRTCSAHWRHLPCRFIVVPDMLQQAPMFKVGFHEPSSHCVVSLTGSLLSSAGRTECHEGERYRKCERPCDHSQRCVSAAFDLCQQTSLPFALARPRITLLQLRQGEAEAGRRRVVKASGGDQCKPFEILTEGGRRHRPLL